MGNLTLVGFMGAGKSSLGREVARLLGFRFIDLDSLIVKEQGRSIPEIFAQEGESAFRKYETAALKALTDAHGAVIATGGGIVGREENWALMGRLGPVIYLRARWETLQNRLASGQGRPLVDMNGWEEVRALWKQRLPLYERADFIFDTDDRGIEELAAMIARQFSPDNGGIWNA